MKIFNKKILRGILILSVFLGCGSTVFATTITFDVQALIDGRDQLIIKGDTLQWHHLDNATVGRHMGQNQPTIFSTMLDGVPELTNIQWIPNWPEAPPAEIRYEAWSSIYTGLTPALPGNDMIVSLIPISSRCATSIVQTPTSENGYSLVVEFNDNAASSSAWYHSRLDISFSETSIPEPITGILFGIGIFGIIGWHLKSKKTLI